MQPEQLLSIIKQPQNITLSDVQELKKILHQYPYFQLAYTLLAKVAYDEYPEKCQEEIQLSAIYATDRNHLKLLLENKLSYAENILKINVKKIVYPATNNKKNNTDIEISSTDFINSYISTIGSKEKKEISKIKSLEQLNIIENFIKEGGKFNPLTNKEISLEESSIDFTKESTILHDNLLTESLAQVMLKQGKFERAIEIYKKLKIKYPEKEAYFSTLSEEIKKEL